MPIGTIVLAAGGSTRLGEPKQLLAYLGQSLLRRAAEAALGVGCGPTVVVLGAQGERMRRELQGLNVRAVECPDWAQGMGASIRAGMVALDGVTVEGGQVEPEGGTLSGVMLTLCDQPLVGAGELRRLVEKFARAGTECAGVAAGYDGTRGVPALFGRGLVEGLRALPVDGGAKRLLYGGGMVEVEMPEAAVDVDTRGQYEALVGEVELRQRRGR